MSNDAPEEERRRAADKAHRGRINSEAADDFVKAGLSVSTARAVVTAIAKGEIRNVGIQY